MTTFWTIVLGIGLYEFFNYALRTWGLPWWGRRRARRAKTPPSYTTRSEVMSRSYKPDGSVVMTVAVFLEPTEAHVVTDTKNAYRVIDGWADPLLGVEKRA